MMTKFEQMFSEFDEAFILGLITLIKTAKSLTLLSSWAIVPTCVCVDIVRNICIY
jgi:hypothetical protein